MIGLSQFRQFTKEAALRAEVQLQSHQQDLLNRSEKTTGILAYHGLGSGKTLSSMAIAENRGGNVLVVTPASLRENYREQLKKFVTDDRHKAYTIVSYDQLRRDPSIAARVKPNTLVADEVHRLRNPGAGREAVEAIRKKTPFMVGLTGSIVNNRPEEIVPLVNLVAGEKVFPSTEHFTQNYIQEKYLEPGFGGWLAGAKGSYQESPKNLADLQKRLKPYVHRFKGDSAYLEHVPSVKEEEIRVPMSSAQVDVYRGILGTNPVLAYKIKNNLPPSKAELKNMNAFMTALRQVSNNPAAFHVKMKDEDSPKLTAMANEIHARSLKDPQFRAVIYSNFLSSGVDPVVAQLRAKGMTATTFTGALNDKQRGQAVKDFNEGRTQVLGLSPAGGEGLDLKGTRLVQLTEEHWNPERGLQAVGRAARYKSHAHLSEGDRNVTVQRYLAVHPKKTGFLSMFSGKPETSADEWINTRRLEKLTLNRQFTEALPTFESKKAGR